MIFFLLRWLAAGVIEDIRMRLPRRNNWQTDDIVAVWDTDKSYHVWPKSK